MGGFINHTTPGPLSSFPLALSIETKRYGGDQRKADVQTATWHVSQWTFLQSLARDKILELPFLLGIVFHAHEWKFVASSRNGNETILWSSCPIGSTITTVGVFQILAGPQRLRKRCEDMYWLWNKRNILHLGQEIE
ncbi:hypothetical protein F53441_12717 [Fusarium austroafricanum]|uniref:PD-(D/E)XK nuclease-like domain-containing protein n=1 Tax=Fusarium austroafricanum TaxID=2364996 RepID=A0A8H4JUV8_9HYPO|nr:hypothetical protein F53441_12717 [Fusarium austroafricanum]